MHMRLSNDRNYLAATNLGRLSRLALFAALFCAFPFLELEVLALNERNQRVASAVQFHCGAGLDEPIEAKHWRRSYGTAQLVIHVFFVKAKFV